MTGLRRLLAALCMWLSMSQAMAGDVPVLRLRLTPLAGTPAPGMQVRMSITPGTRGVRALGLPVSLGPLQGIADRVSDVRLRDAAGALAWRIEDGAADGMLGSRTRRWLPARATRGEVVLDYRVAVSTESVPGPIWELRSEPRGISGAGRTFLLLPDDPRAYRIVVEWDLSAYPQGAQALDSLPAAARNGGQPVLLDALRNAYLMAGDLHALPARLATASGPFRAASTADTPGYSQDDLLAWSQQAYRKLSGFFGEAELPPFTTLFRTNPLTAMSGTAMPGALMSTMAPDLPRDELEQLLVHEMVHVFLDGLEEQSWFQEGLAVAYEVRAPYRLGLFSRQRYIDGINDTLRTYYSNVRKDMPMAQAEAAFWTDARARMQPYSRGGVYFLLVNARLQAASGGRRSLDDAIRAFLARRRAGQAVDVAAWLAMLERDIGPQAHADYAALRDGGLLVLPEDAFGPCFRREQVAMPLFELGFDIASLMQVPRVIRGLVADSPAARAGLRNGDAVTRSVGLDAQQSRPGDAIVLHVEREGRRFEVSFVPAGAPFPGYQWVLADAPGNAACHAGHAP
ncbi:MAG: hypothetical protein QM612_06805 [Thermomonas sp.]|uniref:hypothetical protein n=1 Tax=Thermomonas sp. TaxID=1971895 RepID=UPI0039E55CC5